MFKKTVAATFFVIVWVVLPTSTHAQEFRHKGYDSSRYDYFEIKGATFGKAVEKVTDTVYIYDPVSGEEIPKLYEKKMEAPTSINGKKIYKLNEVTSPAQCLPGTVSVEEYLLENLKDYFSHYKLDSFTIYVPFFDVVADEKGKIVYFVLGGVTGYAPDGMSRTLNNVGLGDRIGAILKDAPTLKPAMLNGKAVPAFTDITFNKYKVLVHKSEMSYQKVAE